MPQPVSPSYDAIEAFDSPAQQAQAVSRFSDSWQFHHDRFVDGGLRNSFTRVMTEQSRVLRLSELRTIKFPRGAPILDLIIDRAGETSQALTIVMQHEGHIVPGDVFCMAAVESFMEQRGL